MSGALWARAFAGIAVREGLRFVRQRGRFFSALVRPLVWLAIFAAGFRTVVEIAPAPPYASPISYEEYVVPGLLAMILLFNGMQAALSMVYDREMGSMRMLLVAPLPRWWLLLCKLSAGTGVAIVQVYAFLAIAFAFDVRMPASGYAALLPALVLSGLALGAIGLLLSAAVRQLENFAGIMNFVIFPTFFLSSALYPLAAMREASTALWAICLFNPFTWMVELLRFALHGQIAPQPLAWTLLTLIAALALAFRGYSPAKGMMARRTGGGD